MTPEQKAAQVNANVACALIELAAMQEANAVARARLQPVPYTDRDMTGLIEQHGIAFGQVREQLR